MCSVSLPVYIGRSIWVSCMLVYVNANNAVLSKNGHKSSQVSLKVTLDSQKFLSILWFVTTSDIKIFPTIASCCCKQKRERSFWSLSFPESKASRFFSGFMCKPKTFFTGFVIQCKYYFESEEKISGFPMKPEKYSLV